MNDINRDQDDDVTLAQINEEWLGKMVRQHTAPQGYECNIGNVFAIGEVMLSGMNARPMVRPSHGLWIPLDHVERVATVEFRTNSEIDTILLTAGGLQPHRVFLNRNNQTVAEFRAQFEAAVAWLNVAEEYKRNITIYAE